ncbi:MAG: DUF459 domain-containing protein [Acidimicrobiales bacterium]
MIVSPRRLPALDGARGVAVVAVLAFHGGVSWFGGGFLGVSTFFTLSGYLITALLLDEWERRGSIDLRAFWARRARRLMPASMLCLIGIAVYAMVEVDPAARASVRGDLLAALGQVANWRFVIDDRSYGDLFTEPSPVLHFWSLAIEEQAYLLLPLVVVAVLAVARTRQRRTVGVVLAAAATVSAVTLVVVASSGSTVQAYYGTHTRAAELLWGAAAAAWLGAPWAEQQRSGRVLGPAAWLAVVAMAAMWATASADALWVYQVALPLHPFLTLVVLVAIARGVGPARALSVGALAVVGRVSYGLYLYHWPIFLWLDPSTTGFDGVALLALRLVVTSAVAALSYHLVEWPIRRMGPLRLARMTVAATVPAAVVVGAVLVGSTAAPPPVWLRTDTEPPPALAARPPRVASTTAVAPRTETSAAESAESVLEQPEELAPLGEPLRVLVVGDSVSLSLGIGLDEWGRDHEALTVWNTGTPGCGIARSTEVRAAGYTGPTPEGCTSWPDLYRDRIETFDPDVVVVLIGAWDAADHRLGADPTWRGPGDDVYDAALADDVLTAVEILGNGGASVVWLQYPYISLARYPGLDPGAVMTEAIPERMDRLNAVVSAALDPVPGVVTLDLAGHLQALPGGEFDPSLRPDGVHFSAEGSYLVAEWLGPSLVEASGHRLPSREPEAGRPS